MGHCLCSHTYSMGLHARFCESELHLMHCLGPDRPMRLCTRGVYVEGAPSEK